MAVTGRRVPAGGAKHAPAGLVTIPAAALALATPVAAWWLVGPLNAAPAGGHLHFAFRPLPVSAAAATAAGAASTVLTVLSLGLLTMGLSWRRQY